MSNDLQRSVLLKARLPLALLPFLASLLVVLSSLSYQHASATRVVHGHSGALDHLVVASHGESLSSKIRNRAKDATAEGDRDPPDWLRLDSTIAWASVTSTSQIVDTVAEHRPSAVRFLIPPARAPPLA